MTRHRLVALALVAVLAATASAQPLALMPVTVVDVTDGTLHPGQTVLLEGDRIAAVGPAAAVRVPEGAEVVDGTGGYLIPGLWDMHVHATWPTRIENFCGRGARWPQVVAARRGPLRWCTARSLTPHLRRRLRVPRRAGDGEAL